MTASTCPGRTSRPGTVPDFPDDTSTFRGDSDFHFHGLQNDQPVALRDGLPGLHAKLPHVGIHRRLHGKAVRRQRRFVTGGGVRCGIGNNIQPGGLPPVALLAEGGFAVQTEGLRLVPSVKPAGPGIP